MIIKSHVRGGYRAAANYLKDIGANEKVRLHGISDPDARTIDEAFHNMWMIGRATRATKPLHHVSINPRKDERLTDAQVLRICDRLEERYGYRVGDHQRVIVEHVKDGRQHFHVMWHRVSLDSGHLIWPGHHWKKSKQTAREMERELGLRRPAPRRSIPSARRTRSPRFRSRNQKERKSHGRHRPRTIAWRYIRLCKHPLRDLRLWMDETRPRRGWPRLQRHLVPARPRAGLAGHDLLRPLRIARARGSVKSPESGRPVFVPRRRDFLIDDLIAWAWENRRADILAQFGIYVTFGM
jgi:hypothetical protein